MAIAELVSTNSCCPDLQKWSFFYQMRESYLFGINGGYKEWEWLLLRMYPSDCNLTNG